MPAPSVVLAPESFECSLRSTCLNARPFVSNAENSAHTGFLHGNFAARARGTKSEGVVEEIVQHTGNLFTKDICVRRPAVDFQPNTLGNKPVEPSRSDFPNGRLNIEER